MSGNAEAASKRPLIPLIPLIPLSIHKDISHRIYTGEWKAETGIEWELGSAATPRRVADRLSRRELALEGGVLPSVACVCLRVELQRWGCCCPASQRDLSASGKLPAEVRAFDDGEYPPGGAIRGPKETAPIHLGPIAGNRPGTPLEGP